MSLAYEKVGPAGVLTLNKPTTLNSFDSLIIKAFHAYIDQATADTEITHLILKSDVPSVFSAGGDLKDIYQHYQRSNQSEIASFFKNSYDLNLRVNQMEKPFISLVDGICMGGAMGLALNGSHTVIFENTQMAMPEIYIGFFPDVGARYFLKECLGHIGQFLALTGYRMTPEDVVYSGLSANYVRYEQKEMLFDALTSVDVSQNPKEGINALLKLFISVPKKESALRQYRTQIDDIFSLSDIEGILPAIKMSKIGWMRQQGQHMMKASPLSLKLTDWIFRNNQSVSLEKALKLDLGLALKFLSIPETIEGIRARIIDKDGAPKWSHKNIYDVPNEEIEKLIELG